MKKNKLLIGLFLSFSSFFSFGQETICDDFTDTTLWATEEITTEGIFGHTQEGAYPITSTTGSWIQLNGYDTGIYGVGKVNLDFSGEDQIARLNIYGAYGQFNQMGFTINGSGDYFMNDSFPLTVDGVTVDLDTSALNTGTFGINSYLTFSGEINEIGIITFESGIEELCVTLLEEEESFDGACEDFTDSTNWPESMIVAGEIIGYTQSDTYAIVAGPETGGSISSLEGIYAFGPVNFEMSGNAQVVRFNIFGFYEQYNQMGFTVNGSADYFMNMSFPIVVDGVTIELDTTAENTGLFGVNAYLTFTGEIENIDIIGFESGIVEMCTNNIEEEEPLVGCEEFTDSTYWTTGTIDEGDTLGYTLEGDYAVVAQADCFGSINSSSNPGIYTVGTVKFDFSGANQTAVFNIYGLYEQYNQMGFSINGSVDYFMDGSFPLTVDGITIDIDTTIDNTTSWGINAHLIFTGEIDAINIIGFESGVEELCLSEVGSATVTETYTTALKLFPNPVYDVVTISHEESIKNVSIYTMSGALIFSKNTIANNLLKINLADYNSGLYIVKTTLENGNESIDKLIKK